MLKKAEISHEIETEKLDVDKRLKEICEIKETLLKIQQDLQDAIKAEGNASVVLKKAISMHIPADTRSAFPVISVQSPVSIQCCWQS